MQNVRLLPESPLVNAVNSVQPRRTYRSVLASGPTLWLPNTSPTLVLDARVVRVSAYATFALARLKGLSFHFLSTVRSLTDRTRLIRRVSSWTLTLLNLRCRTNPSNLDTGRVCAFAGSLSKIS
jgi:hypothetical protein